MKNVLVESTKSKFQVLAQKPANVLKRIKGVLSDFGSNRNGRIYPRELWENVINSDYVKEMINSHGLVGELDHPEERLEISLQEVSHVINDMWIEGDQVMGIIDILPTPNGKIVNELLDYGTDIGISSRGAGSVGAGNVVDPDYQFITFDFVARPSCEAARLNTILEGVKVDLATNSDEKVNAVLESYKDELNESQSQEIEEVIADMRLNIPNIEEYLSAYYKYINGFEPKPAIYKDTGTFNPDWEEWERNTSNVLFSEEAWNKFVKWVKENYNVELKESIKEGYGDRYRTLSEMIKLFKQFSYEYGVKAHREDSRYFQGIADGYEGASFELEHNLDPEKHKLNEAMSDQEVYKVVLNWYKDQIEAGKMTLNQCYELLSDKAKVSLNKLVDQSKIRESVMNKEIKKLLTESEKSLADYDETLRGYNASTAIVIFEAKQYLSKHPFKKDVNKAINYGVEQLNKDVSELESKYGFKDIEIDVDMKAVADYFAKGLNEAKEEGKAYSPEDEKKLKEIYNNLQSGITYGEDMDREHHSWINYPYFNAVLYLIANSPTSAEEVIGWRHYGSSANKNTEKDLKWILDNIFNMTPTEFTSKYIKSTDSKLKEAEEFKPNGVVDDIKKRGDGDLDVESPMELNTGVLPVLDTDTYSRQDWIWDPYRYEDEDGNLPEDDDYGPTYEDLDRCMVDYGAPIVEEYLKKVLPSAKVEGTKMYHPSQYNFSSDELEFKVSFDPKEYYALEDKAVKDPAFKDYLRERYKSYDGFVSYLADNLDEFYQQDGWKRFVQVVMFYLRDEDFEETNDRYWEDIIGNC